MGRFTELELADGQRIAAAHGLGECRAIVPISAGTVNSNYFLDTSRGRYFVRLYEQQDVDGVTYEWALVDFMARGGVPLPARIPGPGPGELRVRGKPVVVYAQVLGEDLCQKRIDAARVRALGAALARAARVGLGFPVIRAGRFGLADVGRLLDQAEAANRSELAAPLCTLRALYRELVEKLPTGLPTGVIHGDLFRDNVLWQGDELVALLDWESASDGILVYDLAVTILAWCCGETLDWALARQLVDGYRQERELEAAEWEALWWHLRAGCLRFATTRIIDVYLKGTYPAGYKEFGRFLLRLDVIEQLDARALAERLGYDPSR
jgi:homoserine kinase type II